MTSWTDERRDLAAKLWNEGVSASEIARTLRGVTRNAVISLIHRKGLSKRGPVAKPTRAPIIVARKLRAASAPPKPTIRIAGHSTFVESVAAPPKVVIDFANAFAPLLGVAPVPFLEREGRRCRWPVGGSGADMLCCGAHAEPGPYCVSHAAAAMPIGQTKAATRLDKRLGIAKLTGRAA